MILKCVPQKMLKPQRTKHFLNSEIEPIRNSFIYAWQDKFVANNSMDHTEWAISDLVKGGKEKILKNRNFPKKQIKEKK